MGNWNINIQGVGAHHNGNPAVDADLAAAELVAKLKAMGQTIQGASFTCGSATDLIEAAKPANKCRVIVNGRECETGGLVSYERLRELAGYETGHPTATYSRARFGREGILSPGRSIEVVDGTIFSVADTSNA